MAETYTAGYVTAYGAAVRGGYTRTYEEFCAEQAKFGENAAAVAQAKADVETMQGQVEQAAATFTGTTVPAAVATVQEAGAAQVQAVQDEGTMQAAAVETVGAQQTAAVGAAGSDAVAAVEAAETAATDAVTAAQTAAVQAVQAESTTQQAAIQTKGQETIDSIPEDYTALSGEVDDLKSALNAEQKLGYIDVVRSTGLETPNLFDINGDNSLTGYYDRTNTFVSNSTVGTTDYIAVIPGVTYSTSYKVSGFVLWYDGSKNFLTYTNKGADDDVTAIPNAQYVKFQLLISDVANLVITANSIKTIDFEDASIITKKVDEAFEFSKNLLNKDDPDYLVDKYYNNYTGALVDPAVGYDQSGFIPVTAGQFYTSNITNFSVVWYKSDKTYLSGTSWATFDTDKFVTAPTNAAYGRFGAQRSNSGFAEWQVVEGKVLPSYMPYGGVSSDKLIIDTAWKGLSGVAFGTSLTYRAQTTGGYLQYLPNLLGATIDNQGIGNATILVTSDFPTLDILAQVKNYADYASKSFCILEGFVNDFYRNADKLGTWKDTGETTVCGCVRSAINHILTANPNITLILVLDHYGCVYNGSSTASTYTNTSGLMQYEYYDEIAKVANSLSVPVIKEYELSGMNEYTPDYFIDNIHPSALGAEQSANTIYYAMKNINVKKASA